MENDGTGFGLATAFCSLLLLASSHMDAVWCLLSCLARAHYDVLNMNLHAGLRLHLWGGTKFATSEPTGHFKLQGSNTFKANLSGIIPIENMMAGRTVPLPCRTQMVLMLSPPWPMKALADLNTEDHPMICSL